MKLPATLLLALAVSVTASSSKSDGNVLMAAETRAPPEQASIYDSRAIAYARFWSDGYQRKLNALTLKRALDWPTVKRSKPA